MTSQSMEEIERECLRLNALHSIGILDTPAEQAYDDLTRLAAFICCVPFALISLVDKDRVWFKSRVGFKALQTERIPENFCVHAIQQEDVFVVPDARLDSRFQQNPFVRGDPNIRFYAGMTLITPEHFSLGTLCVMDTQPRELNEEALAALRVLARQTAAHIRIRTQVRDLLEAAAVREKIEAQLRVNGRELAMLNSRLQDLATTDDLTGLQNRRSFNNRLQDEWELSKRSGNPISLFILDIDHFKLVNDTFGHPDGDQVLKQIARLLPTSVRGTDLVARYGGEEFAVLLPHVTHANALAIAAALQRATSLDWKGHPITVSVGVSTCVAVYEGDPQVELVQAADEALYVAKRNGRNRVQSASSNCPDPHPRRVREGERTRVY